MRVICSTFFFGSVLWLGVPAIVAAQTVDSASQDSAGSPSLLPLPDVAPPPADSYGSSAKGSVSNTAYEPAAAADSVAPPPPTPEPPVASPSDRPVAPSPYYGTPAQPVAPSSSGFTPGYASGYEGGYNVGNSGCNGGCSTGNSGGLLGNSPLLGCFKGWGCNSGCSNGCNAGDSCCCGPGPWFVSLGGLALTRDNPNRFWTTYNTTNNADQVMNTQDAKAGWGGGGEVTLGRWFGGGAGGAMLPYAGMAPGGCCAPCGASGIAATYWGVSPLTGSYSVVSPTDNLGTPINEQTQTGTVMMNSSINGGSTPSSYFFDGAHQQTVSRLDRINNVEVNYLNATPLGGGSTQAIWLAGIRYFRFDETLTYGSVAGGHNFGDGGGAYEAYLRNRSVNNLIGPQIGVILNHYFTPRFSLYAGPRVGVFGNRATSQTMLYTGDGYTTYDLQGTKNSFSVLSQLDLGGTYLLNQRWMLYGGYRLVAITDLALSDNQFLPYLADISGFQQVKTNGGLLLSGVNAGVIFRF